MLKYRAVDRKENNRDISHSQTQVLRAINKHLDGNYSRREPEYVNSDVAEIVRPLKDAGDGWTLAGRTVQRGIDGPSPSAPTRASCCRWRQS